MTQQTILYIEDNPENRLLVKRVLEAEGYKIVEAETGMEGLAKAEKMQPDLILMDINLPELDGYELTRRLKHMKHLSGVPKPTSAHPSSRQKRSGSRSGGRKLHPCPFQG